MEMMKQNVDAKTWVAKNGQYRTIELHRYETEQTPYIH